MSEEGATKGSSILAIVLFGFLSMIISQVFAGTSPLWFLGASDWFMVLPLYWAHALLLLNLAMRYERTSLTQLYLWGIIFGLFEGWITKVIWAGYVGRVPIFGTFLGFAVGEFLVIALFWHAFFSFIVPIMVYQIIVQGTNRGDAGAVHTSHLKVISRGTRSKILLGIFTVISSILIASNPYMNTLAILVAGGINIVYIFVLSWIITSWNKKTLTLESLRLGERGLSITIIYLIVIYAFLFLANMPERIPGIGTILLTIAFYVIVITLIFISPRDTRKTIELPSGIMNFGQIMWALIMIFMLAITWALIPIFPLFLGSLLYLGMIVLGPILFFLAIVMVVRKYRTSTLQPVE
ncbi:MAG: hypothetical protein RTV31_04010 [Candidatus Thorarchaeota archaeon]